MPRKRQIPRAQDAWVIAQQLRTWSQRQWKVAGWSYLGALLVMGTVGETPPGAQSGRVVPVQWWNYVTLAAPAGSGCLWAASRHALALSPWARGGRASGRLPGERVRGGEPAAQLVVKVGGCGDADAVGE